MRLSEAIRLGAMLHPQGFGDLRVFGFDKQVIATCALGGAFVASGLFNEHHCVPIEISAAAFPLLARQIKQCPAGCSGQLRMFSNDRDCAYVITHLNDAHKWTREQIADWVERIEEPVTAAAPITEELVTA